MSTDSKGLTAAATACAVAMIAQQTAGKAVRDALFLSQFEVTALPTILAVSAMLTIAVVLLAGPLIQRLGPGRIIPNAFIASSLLLMLEFGLLQISAKVAAVAIFVHMASFGAVLISGFWSMVSEAFDPRTARKRMARIAAGATLGGLGGGLVAERVASMFGIAAVIPVLAALHLFCSWQCRGLRTETPRLKPEPMLANVEPQQATGMLVLFRSPYLLAVACMLLLGTVGAALVDYVFKAEAKTFYTTDAEGLLRFFAWYYAGTGLLTFALQAGIGRRALAALGLTGAVASNPFAVLVGALGAMLSPGLVALTAVRGAEAATRSSLFRSGYELLFTPVPRADRRATKTLIDVGFDRLGDALGAGIAALALAVAGVWANQALLGMAAALSIGGLLLARRLKFGYQRALKVSLLTQAESLQLAEPDDQLTRDAMMETMGTIDLKELVALAKTRRESTEQPEAPVRNVSPSASSGIRDSVARRMAALRSGDTEQVRKALRAPVDRLLASQVVSLLGWDPARALARDALGAIGPSITGLLADHLLDPDEEFIIRRRVPAVLAEIGTVQAARALQAGLSDKRFEVRFRCGRGLTQIRAQLEGHVFEATPLIERILAEVGVSHRVWESQRLLDGVNEAESPFVDAMLRDRANRSLEHVFTLLALFQPPEPLIVAYRGLHTDDQQLRGTALEYLDVTLPPTVRAVIWPFLGEGEQVVNPTVTANAFEALMKSNASIELRLSQLNRVLDP